MRGGIIVGVVLLSLWPAALQAHGTHAADEIVTHTAHGVRLTLIVRRTTYPVNALATIKPPPSTRARVYDVSSARCSHGGTDTAIAHANWLPVRGARITAGCAPVAEWHLLVGQLNHSVSTVDVTRQ